MMCSRGRSGFPGSAGKCAASPVLCVRPDVVRAFRSRPQRVQDGCSYCAEIVGS